MNWKCADTYATQWFQQDGATPHAAGATIGLIREYSGGCIISRNTRHPWPANFPDLSPLDYFLWGHLRSTVYKDNPKELKQLKRAVRVPCGVSPPTRAGWQ